MTAQEKSDYDAIAAALSRADFDTISDALHCLSNTALSDSLCDSTRDLYISLNHAFMLRLKS